MLKIIKQFLTDYKKYMFKYRNGFYQVPFLINSPKTAIESFKKIPFVKWDSSACKLSANNMFVQSDAYYIEINEGLWFYASELYSKVNLEFIGYFSENEPKEYFNFGYNLIKHNSKKKIALNSGLSYSVGSWNFFKPNHKLHHIVFKDTNIQVAGLYISQKWINENILTNKNYLKSDLNLFINSKSTFSLLSDTDFNPNYINNALNIAKITDRKQRQTELEQFAANTIEYLLNNHNTNYNNYLIDADADLLIKLTKVEKRLNDCLLVEFPGIETLATEINISSAKLKTDFKKYFGDSIYQYYLGKQLLLARDLLTKHQKSVGETAQIFGYKNIGKFTVAFEKKFGILPSKVI